MKGPPLGAGEEDTTWLDQVAPRGQRTPSTRHVKPQTSSLMKNFFIASARSPWS